MIPVEERSAENYPFRDRKGLKPFSLKVWLAGGPGQKPRKPMNRPAYEGKSDEQKAYEAENVDEYGKPVCEAWGILDRLQLESWERFKRNNKKAWALWNHYETHHVHGRDEGHERWNLIRTCAGVHKFLHEKPALARLVTYLAKDAKGEFDLPEVIRVTRRNPLAFVEADIKRGVFSGRARGEAVALCRKYGTKS